jgi:hypothetical protein
MSTLSLPDRTPSQWFTVDFSNDPLSQTPAKTGVDGFCEPMVFSTVVNAYSPIM